MFPGGHVEIGETPHVAALREAEEEVGLAVLLRDSSDLPSWSDDRNRRLPQPLAMIEEALPDGGCYVDVVFVGLAARSDLRLTGEIDEADWFDGVQLEQLETIYPIRELALRVLRSMREWRP
jgi:8-oxo-dGTP pyrophosphatase MutT (NUDIX family)